MEKSEIFRGIRESLGSASSWIDRDGVHYTIDLDEPLYKELVDYFFDDTERQAQDSYK